LVNAILIILNCSSVSYVHPKLKGLLYTGIEKNPHLVTRAPQILGAWGQLW